MQLPTSSSYVLRKELIAFLNMNAICIHCTKPLNFHSALGQSCPGYSNTFAPVNRGELEDFIMAVLDDEIGEKNEATD